MKRFTAEEYSKLPLDEQYARYEYETCQAHDEDVTRLEEWEAAEARFDTAALKFQLALSDLEHYGAPSVKLQLTLGGVKTSITKFEKRHIYKKEDV